MRPFFEELRRRNVFRVAAAYLVAAWLIIQVVDVVGPILGLPAWMPRTILLLLGLGFVAAIVLSWVYELTEKGIQRDEDVDRSRLVQPVGGRKLDFAIIALLAVAVAFMFLDKYVAWEPERSVAVLPFVSLNADSEETVFVDGMHSGIVARLAKLRSLDKVISTSSVERFRDSDLTVPEIADKLDVATILKGDVQRSNDRLRINVHLVRAADDAEIWAETYERELNTRSLFAAQADIARNVAAGLHLVLSDEEARKLEFGSTDSLEAYEEWVRGKNELRIPTEQRVVRAMKHFERAIELDPNYVLAWVGITDALNNQRALQGREYASGVLDRWLEAVETALEIDPVSTEALVSLATLKVLTAQFEVAEEYILKALELTPNHAPAYALYSGLLRAQGRLDEAKAASDKSMKLEPIPMPSSLASRAWTFLFLGDYEQVEAIVVRGLREDPDYYEYYLPIWMANEIRNPGKALRWAEEGLKNAPFHPWLLRGKCEALINLDMPDRARQCIAEVEDRFGDAPALRNSLAMLEGNFDEVVARIEPFLDDTSLPSWLRNEICIPLILAGRSDLAWPVMLDARPDWTGDEPVDFASVNFFRMVPAAALLYENGRIDRANYLFDGMLKAMAGQRFRRGVGSLDVGIHYVRGDYEKAAVALRDAIDDGVYGGWWYYDRSPVYDDMRADPELSALLEEMKAEIARQREWYEQNRNKPLF